MTEQQREAYFRQAFAVAQGGIAVIPATTMTPEETAAAFAEAEREWRQRHPTERTK